MQAELLSNVLWIGLRSGTPLLLATVGEIYAERSGILNLGIEGMMIIGAFTAFAVGQATSSSWIAILAAAAAGLASSLIHAFISVHLRGNQVVSGLALTMFGLGLTSVAGGTLVGAALPREARIIPHPVNEQLADIPVVGKAIFDQDPFLYLSLLTAVALWYVLYRTKLGIVIRSVGENPAAADALGVNVYAVRYACTALGGALAGMAGSYISLSLRPGWVENITAGRGWIAVALTIFALWDPLKAVAGSYLFGIVEAGTYNLQPLGFSQWLLNAIPYVLTVIILVAGATETMRKKMGAPAALGVPYARGEK